MSSQDRRLSLVKYGITNVSQYVGSTADPCLTKGLVSSSPAILKSGSSFYLDYTHTTNGADLKFLKRFFSYFTAGQTFATSGGTYYVEDTGTQYNFAGIYSFQGSTGSDNQYLYFGGVTYSTGLVDGLYESDNFLTALNYSAVKGNTAQYFMSKVNRDDPNNIDFLGLYGNDYGYEEYLETTPGMSNATRYLIDNAIKLNDGSEIIYLNSATPVVSESRYFIPTTLNIYMRAVPDLNTLAVSTNINGIVKKINSDGTTLKVYQNQNVRQKYCRNANDDEYFYDWYSIIKSSTQQNILNPLAYNGLSLSYNYRAYIKIGVGYFTITPGVGFENINDQVYTQNLSLFIDDVPTNNLDFTTTGANPTGTTIKIDISDSSLFNAVIEPFLDAECSVRLNTNYFMLGVPGLDNSSFIYIKKLNGPSVIYLKFTKVYSLILRITV